MTSNTAPAKTIMIIDDDRNLLFSLQRLFEEVGYRVISVDNGSDGLKQIQSHTIDLVLCDVMMPPPNGFSIQKLLNQNPQTSGIPFIFLSALDSKQHLLQSLQNGADDFFSKPFDPDLMLARVQSSLRRAELNQENGFHKVQAMLDGLLDQQAQVRDDAVESLARALDLRDPGSGDHSFRVASLSVRLALAIGIQAPELNYLRWGALLHDVGKIAIPDDILNKGTQLDQEEWRAMRQHPVHALKLLSRYEIMLPILDIPRYHHERWDGSGYPEGLSGDQIPLWAQLVGLVDVWDALTFDRPYRAALGHDKAREFLVSKKGTWFQPHLVDTFLAVLNEKGD